MAYQDTDKIAVGKWPRLLNFETGIHDPLLILLFPLELYDSTRFGHVALSHVFHWIGHITSYIYIYMTQQDLVRCWWVIETIPTRPAAALIVTEEFFIRTNCLGPCTVPGAVIPSCTAKTSIPWLVHVRLMVDNV